MTEVKQNGYLLSSSTPPPFPLLTYDSQPPSYPCFLAYVQGGFLILDEKELCLLLWAIEKPVLTAFLGFDSKILSCLIVS